MKFLQPFKGILFEKNSKYISIGRFFLLITFSLCCFLWIRNAIECSAQDIPKSLENIIMFLLIYNFGKKVSVLRKKDEPKNEQEILHG